MSKPVIVVVDDEPQVLRAIGRDLLGRYGRDYRIVRASSGPEAMDVLGRERDAAQPVALVLSDQRMPGMDGVSLLTEARRVVPAAKRALLSVRGHRGGDRRDQSIAGGLLPSEAVGSA